MIFHICINVIDMLLVSDSNKEYYGKYILND